MPLTRRDVVLAALAASGGSALSPAQAQKLLFLIDRKIPHFIGGEKFNFKPYDYGPFDRSVYSELEGLEVAGLARIDRSADNRWNMYGPTEEGMRAGQEALEEIPKEAAEYMHKLSSWVRSCSFSELVASIYKMYPEMKVNSVFKG